MSTKCFIHTLSITLNSCVLHSPILHELIIYTVHTVYTYYHTSFTYSKEQKACANWCQSYIQ